MVTLRTALDALRVGVPVRHESLTLFPLIGDREKPRPYLTLDEALAAGSARVTEVGEEGHVPELWLYNDGELPVLLLDGEELRGAKQNRVLNLTILAEAHDKTVIPVSCVEQGRWRAQGAAFFASPNVMYSAARRAKVEQVSASLSQNRGYTSNQRAVWNELAMKAERLGASSRTGAMDDTYRHAHRSIEDYVRAFAPAAGQVGAVFVLDGRIAGCEAFDHPDTLALLLPKLVRSYALDAIEVPPRDTPVPVTADAARAFLDEVGAAASRAFLGVGLGETIRISAPRVTGAALVHRDELVHLSAFRAEGGDGNTGAGPNTGDRGVPMARWSLRRLFRG